MFDMFWLYTSFSCQYLFHTFQVDLQPKNNMQQVWRSLLSQTEMSKSTSLWCHKESGPCGWRWSPTSWSSPQCHCSQLRNLGDPLVKDAYVIMFLLVSTSCPGFQTNWVSETKTPSSPLRLLNLRGKRASSSANTHSILYLEAADCWALLP